MGFLNEDWLERVEMELLAGNVDSRLLLLLADEEVLDAAFNSIEVAVEEELV